MEGVGGQVIKQVHWFVLGFSGEAVGGVDANGQVKEVDALSEVFGGPVEV